MIPAGGRKTLVLGGVRSGKSRLAGDLARAAGIPVAYVATAQGRDEEMRRRIASHRAQRPAGWRVIEEPVALSSAIRSAGVECCVVVDCLTLWLTNVLLSNADTLDRERRALLETVASWGGTLILIGNETNSGVIPRGRLSRRFCDEAGILHQELARRCDRVVLCVAGLPLPLKVGT